MSITHWHRSTNRPDCPHHSNHSTVTADSSDHSATIADTAIDFDRNIAAGFSRHNTAGCFDRSTVNCYIVGCCFYLIDHPS